MKSRWDNFHFIKCELKLYEVFQIPFFFVSASVRWVLTSVLYSSRDTTSKRCSCNCAGPFDFLTVISKKDLVLSRMGIWRILFMLRIRLGESPIPWWCQLYSSGNPGYWFMVASIISALIFMWFNDISVTHKIALWLWRLSFLLISIQQTKFCYDEVSS